MHEAAQAGDMGAQMDKRAQQLEIQIMLDWWRHQSSTE